jgi:predicted dehydrogenase
MAHDSCKQPIRVGVFGLSTSGGWAATAHLPYLQATAKYKVTAICNTSVQTSRQAIQEHGFESAQAFDSVQAMCESDSVDLVVCAVAVFSHYKIVKPAIEAGKDVYVEWPLGVSTEEGEKLEALAEKKGVRTIIGLQGRVSHIQATLRDLINKGRLVHLLSHKYRDLQLPGRQVHISSSGISTSKIVWLKVRRGRSCLQSTLAIRSTH